MQSNDVKKFLEDPDNIDLIVNAKEYKWINKHFQINF